MKCYLSNMKIRTKSLAGPLSVRNTYKIVNFGHANADEKKIEEFRKQQLTAVNQEVARFEKLAKSPGLRREEQKIVQNLLPRVQEFKKAVLNAIDMSTTVLNTATVR